MANNKRILKNVGLAVVIVTGALLLLSDLNKSFKKAIELQIASNFILIKSSHSDQPGQDFYQQLFQTSGDTINTLLDKREKARLKELLNTQLNSFLTEIKKGTRFSDSEKRVFRNQRDSIWQLLRSGNSKNECTQKGCSVFAEVIKSTQLMYLYVDGELRDTFKVSTGMEGYETPEMNVRPKGPMKAKYTSTKYPGGNYNGLGNMPYVVFIKGPYAIHGTTKGNFSKLGRKASHGCIRLHPDNALVFFELVKLVGLENTWVSVREEENSLE